MEEGRLTDSHGKIADFRNTLIIFSANAGVEEMDKGAMGFVQREQQGGISDRVMSAIKGMFRPEFLNRLEVIMFNRLSHHDVRKIVDIEIGNLNRLLLDRRISLQITDEARDFLAKIGFDPERGARPLKNVITNLIKTPLANELLKGTIPAGVSLSIHAENGQLVLPWQ
jgi:ATP-dependent Clp protease ATP-binding subunit ClpA